MPPLQAFELPFAYIEAGEKKQALVKVKVCEKCARKITYKPSNDGESSRSRGHQARYADESSFKSDAVEDDLGKSSKTSSRIKEGRQTRRSESPRRR